MIWITILYVAFIFSNSATPGVYSSAESSWVTDLLNRWMQDWGLAFIRFSEGFIRKAAHFAEYGVLGVMLTLSVAPYPFFQGKRRWLLVFLGLCIAAVDEGIQFFTPGRDCNPMDVLLDTIGVCFGVAFCMALSWLRDRWRERKTNETGGRDSQGRKYE